ncbi:hypothetical protein ACFWDQ_17265 [Streptomyces sp. NPDC060053]|uniref:hypothetical protein n=1 Tax=Streptomyces sp. NPDC060053 TaxID=3347047 RepID=UPI00367F490F
MRENAVVVSRIWSGGTVSSRSSSDAEHQELGERPERWAGQPGLALPEAWEKDMDGALDAAVADTPDTAPLHALLAGTHRVFV